MPFNNKHHLLYHFPLPNYVSYHIALDKVDKRRAEMELEVDEDATARHLQEQ
jgi:hypothetical protein